MRLAVLSLLVFAGTSFACTVESTTSTAPGPTTPGSEQPGDVGSKPPAEGTPAAEAPWRDWSVPSEVRTITCPTNDTVHVATAKGVFSLAADKWNVVAEGDFNAVHLHDANTGFAAGDGLLWQRADGKWHELDGAKGYKISGVFSNAEGAYLVGSGFQYIGKGGLPVEPKVMFVANDLTLRPERSYGHRLTAGNITSIAGAGSTVAIGGSLTMMYSSAGSEWQPFGKDYYLTGTVRSVAVTKWGLYATNGSEVAMPNGVQYDPVGGGPDIHHLVASQSNVIAIGAHGAMEVVAGSKEMTIDPPADVTLTAGCATSDGHLWVASGTRVFRRRDAL